MIGKDGQLYVQNSKYHSSFFLTSGKCSIQYRRSGVPLCCFDL